MTGSRRRWLVAGGAAVALFGTGMVVGRGLGPDVPDDVPAFAGEPSSIADRVGSSASPTAGPDAVSPEDPPGGFPRTPDGAVVAATAYGLALGGPGLLDPSRRQALLGVFAASYAREELEAVLGGVAELITSRLALAPESLADPRFVWRVVPAGWQLRDYSDQRAVVAIWATGVVVADGRPLVQPGWRTTEVELVWERDGWRLVGFRTQPGPQPPLIGDPAGSAAGLVINEFRPYRHLPAQPREQ